MVDVQQTLAGHDFAAVDGIRVCAAIHVGPADERDGDYFEPTANRRIDAQPDDGLVRGHCAAAGALLLDDPVRGRSKRLQSGSRDEDARTVDGDGDRRKILQPKTAASRTPAAAKIAHERAVTTTKRSS